jgi:hypothetical protein
VRLVVREKTSTLPGITPRFPGCLSQSPHITQVKGTKIFLNNRTLTEEDILKQSDLNRVQNQHFGELLYLLNQPGKQLEQSHTKNAQDFSKFFTL